MHEVRHKSSYGMRGGQIVLWALPTKAKCLLHWITSFQLWCNLMVCSTCPALISWVSITIPQVAAQYQPLFIVKAIWHPLSPFQSGWWWKGQLGISRAGLAEAHAALWLPLSLSLAIHGTCLTGNQPTPPNLREKECLCIWASCPWLCFSHLVFTLL